MTGPDLVVAGLPILKDAQSGISGPFSGCIAHKVFLSFWDCVFRFYIKKWGLESMVRYN